MSEEKLLTVEQFNNQVTKWTLVVKRKAKRTLSEKTHASGRLATNIDQFVDKLSHHDPAYKVKFNFLRYGVYRSYGAGRGYVIVNGVPVRGYRVRSDREIRKKIFGPEASEMLKRGYLVREVNMAKKVRTDDLSVARTPLDWMDKHINDDVGALADLVQEFYGDEALRQMLDDLPKLKIKKK